MKHLDPRQLPQSRGRTPSRSSSVRRALFTLFAIIAGGGVLGTWVFGGSGADVVSEKERNSRQIGFFGTAPLALSDVGASEVTQALAQMKLPVEAQAKLQQELRDAAARDAAAKQAPGADFAPVPEQLLKAQRLRLVQVTLWDTHSEDGDVVAITSAGYRREVVIRNSPQVLTIPADASGRIEVTGVRDGGGGITLGISGTDRQILMPVMREGQSIPLPIK